MMLPLRNLPATMVIIFSFTASAMAADLPKEGTFKGTYTIFGTYKTTKIGDDRALSVIDENGAQVTDGFANHMTFHCWGTVERANGESGSEGYCVWGDPTGDLIESKFVWPMHKRGEKVVKGSASFVAGTGKFAGVSGTATLVNHFGEFRPLLDGTYVEAITVDGNYRLP